MNYSPELKDALLRRMLPPNNESITKISRELMLLLMYNTGVRVSELLEIKVADIHGADSVNHASVIIHGKGCKQ